MEMHLLQFSFTQRSSEQMQVLKEKPLLILISALRSRLQPESLKLSFLLGVFFYSELLFEDWLLHNNLTWPLEVKENSCSLLFGKRCWQLCGTWIRPISQNSSSGNLRTQTVVTNLVPQVHTTCHFFHFHTNPAYDNSPKTSSPGS